MILKENNFIYQFYSCLFYNAKINKNCIITRHLIIRLARTTVVPNLT